MIILACDRKRSAGSSAHTKSDSLLLDYVFLFEYVLSNTFFKRSDLMTIHRFLKTEVCNYDTQNAVHGVFWLDVGDKTFLASHTKWLMSVPQPRTCMTSII